MADVLMKSRTVETVTSNEGLVRLRIYDGEIPLDQAAEELLRLYREQVRHEALRHDETRKEMWALKDKLRKRGIDWKSLTDG